MFLEKQTQSNSEIFFLENNSKKKMDEDAEMQMALALSLQQDQQPSNNSNSNNNNNNFQQQSSSPKDFPEFFEKLPLKSGFVVVSRDDLKSIDIS